MSRSPASRTPSVSTSVTTSVRSPSMTTASWRRSRTVSTCSIGWSAGCRRWGSCSPVWRSGSQPAEGRRAGAEAVEQFLQPLTTFAAWTLAVVGVVAAVAVLTGDYPWVVSLRRLVGELRERLAATTGERASDEATGAWIGDHRDVLLIGVVVVGLVLLWIADQSWAGLLLVLGLVAAFEVVVYRTAARPAMKNQPSVTIVTPTAP